MIDVFLHKFSCASNVERLSPLPVKSKMEDQIGIVDPPGQRPFLAKSIAAVGFEAELENCLRHFAYHSLNFYLEKKCDIWFLFFDPGCLCVALVSEQHI